MWDAATDEDGRVYAVGGNPVKGFDARAGRGRDGAVEVARGSARLVLVLGLVLRATTEQERSDLLHAIYTRITVTHDGFDSVELTPDADAHGQALSMHETVTVGALAPPASAGDAFTTTIPIEGRDEWIAALDAAVEA